jgi:plastocyanin
MKTIIILDLICMLVLATTLTSFSVSTVMAQNVTDVQRANNTAGGGNKVSIVEGASDLGNKSYQPSPIKSKVGDTITWTNDDSIAPHTVTEGNLSSSMSGAGFDSGLLSQGQTFKHTFSKVGVVEYFCSLHPTMVGKVSVSS